MLLCFYSSAISPLFTFVARVAFSRSLPSLPTSLVSPSLPVWPASPSLPVSHTSPSLSCHPCHPYCPHCPHCPCCPRRLHCPCCPCCLRCPYCPRRLHCPRCPHPSFPVSDCSQQCVISSSSFPSPVPRSRLWFLGSSVSSKPAFLSAIVVSNASSLFPSISSLSESSSSPMSHFRVRLTSFLSQPCLLQSFSPSRCIAIPC